MARRSSRRRAARSPRPLGGVSPDAERQQYDGRLYWVRRIPGASATKVYRCPLCDDQIAVAEPHVVAWPADERDGLAARRHWHTRCWLRR